MVTGGRLRLGGRHDRQAGAPVRAARMWSASGGRGHRTVVYRRGGGRGARVRAPVGPGASRRGHRPGRGGDGRGRHPAASREHLAVRPGDARGALAVWLQRLHRLAQRGARADRRRVGERRALVRVAFAIAGRRHVRRVLPVAEQPLDERLLRFPRHSQSDADSGFALSSQLVLLSLENRNNNNECTVLECNVLKHERSASVLNVNYKVRLAIMCSN